MDLKNKDFIELLKRTQEKIAEKENWCQWALATNAQGMAVDALDVNACRWCLLGALDCFRQDYGLNRANVVIPLLEFAKERFPAWDGIEGGHITLQYINDTGGFENVHEFIDYCLSQLTKEEIINEPDAIVPCNVSVRENQETHRDGEPVDDGDAS